MRNVSVKVVERMKTHFLFNNFYFPENRVVSEIIFTDNLDKYGRGGRASDDSRIRALVLCVLDY
jgi:hypothetical protein